MCGKQFVPTQAMQRYCGAYSRKEGCSYMNFVQKQSAYARNTRKYNKRTIANKSIRRQELLPSHRRESYPGVKFTRKDLMNIRYSYQRFLEKKRLENVPEWVLAKTE